MIVLFMHTPSMFANNVGNPCVGYSRRELRDVVDATVLLPRLKLRPHDQPRSHSVLPASCIHNGALIIANGAHHFAIMSPRELKECVSFTSAEAL